MHAEHADAAGVALRAAADRQCVGRPDEETHD
jgi:hypothetical protein